MKDLLRKELSLNLSPNIIIFMCLGPIMMLIPNYPRYVGFYYVCISICLIFSNSLINKDMVYTACLPVRKSDVVKARFLLIALLELVEAIICVPFGILANSLMPQGNAAGIDTNVAFYGLLFIVDSLFNLFFLAPCYRKPEKPYWPLLYGSIAFWTGFVFAELPIWMGTPLGRWLKGTSPAAQLSQLPLLGAGLLVWVLILLGSYRLSVRAFEKVDL